ncbi:hypothetical protein GCM10022224_013580 [Nonomuraea antimicrobica]|uniref:Uncharacterized protein n=1 Tax=Nonomuraea antimicrobica TaxID=561173 RepID=A0ABP7B982_9ACTN
MVGGLRRNPVSKGMPPLVAQDDAELARGGRHRDLRPGQPGVRRRAVGRDPSRGRTELGQDVGGKLVARGQPRIPAGATVLLGNGVRDAQQPR